MGDREICDCPVCGRAHWKLGNPPKGMFATEEQSQRGLNDIWPMDEIEAPGIPSPATIATLTAALEEARGALEAFGEMQTSITTDVLTAHQARGAGASGWMREDDSEMRGSLRYAFERTRAALATINAALGRVEG